MGLRRACRRDLVRKVPAHRGLPASGRVQRDAVGVAPRDGRCNLARNSADGQRFLCQRRRRAIHEMTLSMMILSGL